MSPSDKPTLLGMILLVFAAILAALLLVRNQSLPVEDSSDHVVLVESGEGLHPVVSRHKKEIARQKPGNRPTRTQAIVTSGIRTIPLHTPTPLPPLTGYCLDRFDGWFNIPPGYHAEGVVISQGALTLSLNENATSEPRTGLLISPPLPLRSPSMAAPVSDNKTAQEGTDIQLEISLSEDGETWSPWAMADRHRPPDGKLVTPPVQAALSTTDIAVNNRDHASTISLPSGPSLRYRLSLSATGMESPSVTDVRIWKREYQ